MPRELSGFEARSDFTARRCGACRACRALRPRHMGVNRIGRRSLDRRRAMATSDGSTCVRATNAYLPVVRPDRRISLRLAVGDRAILARHRWIRLCCRQIHRLQGTPLKSKAKSFYRSGAAERVWPGLAGSGEEGGGRFRGVRGQTSKVAIRRGSGGARSASAQASAQPPAILMASPVGEGWASFPRSDASLLQSTIPFGVQVPCGHLA